VFSIDINEPPIAKSGIKYKTVNERCMACEVYGGDEEMCISRKDSKREWIPLGRPCPRVDLSLRNELAAATAYHMLSETTRPSAPFWLMLNAGSVEDARLSLGRAMSAVKSVKVQEALTRMHAREAKKDAAARKSEENAARERRRVVKGLQSGRR